MEWNHLPEPGGIYQQHPKLLGDWEIIWHEQYEHEKRKKQREELKRRASR